MIGSHEQAARAPGPRIALAWLVAAAWIAWGLARHPAFQPVPALRLAAPLVALAMGVVLTRRVALARARVDAGREFDRGGKALFMGFVMVGVTFAAWLLVSQAIPGTLNAVVGRAATEPGVVVRRVPATADAGCGFRLEVASAAAANGGVQRTMDECVDQDVWQRAAEGDAVTLQLVRSAFGAELVGVTR